MRAGQSSGATTDNRDCLATGCGSLEKLLIVLEHRIGCVSLQQANLYGFFLVQIANASFFASASVCKYSALPNPIDAMS